VAGYGEGGVVEGVRLDQGTVKVDAKHRKGVDGGGGGRNRQMCPSLRLTLYV
jgi:hypothetical protein